MNVKAFFDRYRGPLAITLISVFSIALVWGVLYLPSQIYYVATGGRQTQWGWPTIKKILFLTPGSGGNSSVLNADVTRNAFAAYVAYLGARKSVPITIYSTIDEFKVESLVDVGQEQGTARFLVTPQQYQFSMTDIEERVHAGLVSEDNNHHPLKTPLWGAYSISTNTADRTWTVNLSGIGGEGTIRLSIGEASAEIPVSLPKLYPIWNYVRYADSRNGIVRIGGYDLQVDAVLKPDFDNDKCGYKVHSISNQTIWFEVIYSEPSPKITRSRWPDVRIEYRELDNGQSYSTISFEGGFEMKPGDIAVLDENELGDSLKLDADSFVANRAVRFRYCNKKDERIADMIAVTFQ